MGHHFDMMGLYGVQGKVRRGEILSDGGKDAPCTNSNLKGQSKSFLLFSTFHCLVCGFIVAIHFWEGVCCGF